MLLIVMLALLSLAGCSKGEYVGSSISKTYHDPTCIWAEQLDRDREVWFDTAEAAEDAGFRPCSGCLAGP
jgi:methylphosphotriester-DNA--protein-cysteine methyltransferase